MEMIKIKLKEPLIRSHDGFRLDVSQKAFEANPDKIYHVPDSNGWMKECFNDNGKAIMIGRVDAKSEPVKVKTPTKKEVVSK